MHVPPERGIHALASVATFTTPIKLLLLHRSLWVHHLVNPYGFYRFNHKNVFALMIEGKQKYGTLNNDTFGLITPGLQSALLQSFIRLMDPTSFHDPY
ncbi:hypothetical protein FRC03_003127 [Tulasnella sp. 419]|nr:hypothetical protein FRC03_003127 [Tulasnella sp. 419]